MPSNWYTVTTEMHGFHDWFVPVNYMKTNTVTHKLTVFDFRDAYSNTYGLLPDIQFFHASDTDWYFMLLIFCDDCNDWLVLNLKPMADVLLFFSISDIEKADSVETNFFLLS